MKKILSNNITATAAQPFKQGTWTHLQEGISESLEAIGRLLVGPNYDATKVYILYGCVNSTTAPNYTVSAGAVFYAGEIYLVPAFTFTAGTAAVGAITVNYFAAANADPVEFTDGNNHNVHAIYAMEVTDTTSAGNLNFDNWIVFDKMYESTSVASIVVSTSTGTASAISINYTKLRNCIMLTYDLSVTVTVASASGIDISIPLPIPAVASATTTWKAAGCMINGATRTLTQASINTFTDNTHLIISGKANPGTGTVIFSGQIFYNI